MASVLIELGSLAGVLLVCGLVLHASATSRSGILMPQELQKLTRRSAKAFFITGIYLGIFLLGIGLGRWI